jgi:carboxymethylenebutenolidase
VAAAVAAIETAGLAQAQSPPQCAGTVKVAETDPAIAAQAVTLHGEGGPLFGYLAVPAPAFADRRPAVIVVHENRGLNEHIRDVTRRVAKAGFVALAIDLLSRQGGTGQFPDPEQAGAAYGRTLPEERRQDLMSGLLTIREQSYVVRDKVGVVGFCAGGSNVFDLAANTDQLAAAVAFYGFLPNPIDPIANITAPLLGIFAELDRGVNARLPGLITTLVERQKTYELHVYGNTRHAFHNDTGTNYDPAAACDAWAKTLAFFNRHLTQTAPA